MPSQLSSLSSDLWLDMASAAPQPFEKDEPIREVRPPVCGDGLRRLLSSKSHMRSPLRKKSSCGKLSSEKESLLVGGAQGLKNRGIRLTSNRNEDKMVEGRVARSPSNDSTSSEGVGETKRNRRILSELLTTATGRDGEGQEVAPYYVLQFDPSESSDSTASSPKKETQEDKQTSSSTEEPRDEREENTKPGECASGGLVPHTSYFVQRIPQGSSKTKGKPSSWSTSLPSVAEDIFEEGSTQSTSSRSTNSPSHPEMLRAMRSLIRKQQKSIEDMENENKRFREELAQYRKMLSEAHIDRTSKEDRIGLLTAEKRTTESATLWLREEMKALKAEIARMKVATHNTKELFLPHANRGTEVLQPLYRSKPRNEKDPELIQFLEVKKAIYGSVLELDGVQKSKSEDSIADSSIFTNEKRDDVTAASSTNSLNDCERQSDDHQRVVNNSRSTSSQNSGPLENRLHAYFDNDEQAGIEISHAIAARSKEEVNLFKSRLEAIQKKREERKIREGDFGSRSGRVRFD